jgi:hypothetical protein
VALTLAEAQQLRADYYSALRAIATGKSYTIGSRSLTRADERFVSEQFAKYDALVEALQNGSTAGARITRIVPRDL